MIIHLSNRLVAAMCAEYPGCLPSSEAVGDMAEALISQHLAMNRRTRQLIDEHTLVADRDLAPEPSAAN